MKRGEREHAAMVRRRFRSLGEFVDADLDGSSASVEKP
jgi:hypothetical protein